MHRHQYQNRKLSRERGPRKALLRGLVTSVILYERIKTTLPKAKEIRPIVEKLITAAKKGDLSAIRMLSSYLYGENVVQKLVTEIAPIYKDRNGGYTRIVKLGNRPGDNAPMAIIEFVDIEKLVKASVPAKVKNKAVISTEVEKSTKKTKPAVKKASTKKAAPKENK
jgi:large subunit ribosomal protein L17